MKKLTTRLRRKRVNAAPPMRITNETVAEHRERILAGGRRFKYPMQYARHRLVFNTIIIGIVALIILVVVGWWQLYPEQNTSTFFYRVTRVLPLPVGSVDGQPIPYSDYLMYYNSSAHYLQQSEQLNFNSTDGKHELDYVKRKSLDNAINDAYAVKLAKQLHINVSPSQVDQVISNDRNTVNGRISQETYDASAMNILGWTPAEYRQAAQEKLLVQAVSYKIDTAAAQKEQQAATLVAQPNTNFDTIATQLGGTGSAKVTSGVSGMVPKTNSDGGLSQVASKLKTGQTSAVIKTTTGDGYYFVKLLDENDADVNYAYIRIPLTKFTSQLVALKKDHKVQEYIKVADVNTSTTTN